MNDNDFIEAISQVVISDFLFNGVNLVDVSDTIYDLLEEDEMLDKTDSEIEILTSEVHSKVKQEIRNIYEFWEMLQ